MVTALHITRGPNVVVKSEREVEARWCFKCRKRLAGLWELLDYAEPSYYDPVWAYRCDGCGEDHSRFPGWCDG